jgi:hypothetical protein
VTAVSAKIEIALVLVCLDHIASRIVNANQSVPWASFVGRFGDQKITAPHAPQV